MIKIFKFLKPYIWQIILLIILVFISVAATLKLPDYMANIINKGIVGSDNHAIWVNGGWMLLVSLIGGVATIGIGYYASKIATGFSKDIRQEVFSKVESFSLLEFNKFSTASLITRTTNDVQQVQMVAVMLLRMVLQAPVTGIWAIIKAYNLAPSMSWIIALAVCVLLGVILILFSIALPKFKLLQKLVDKLNLVTRQNLTGLRVIRAFNNEKIEEKKFEKANEELTNLNLFVNRLMVIMQPVMMLIFNLTAVLIVWIGAHLVDSGNLLIGNMIAFLQYAMQVIMAFLMMSIIFIMVPRGSVSASRIMEVIDTVPSIRDPKKPVPIKNKNQGIVEFKNVTFSYAKADEPVLQNISFIAQSGQTTAIIGGTGSGKTTLINLIPRFYDATKGEILIDGVNIKDMALEDLYAKIGYVPQKGVLFSGSIKSNIIYGAPDANSDAIKKAARIAQATEFINEKKEKFSSPISQGGANVSGGQKQRLSIARAIIRKPEIYIFDDSFSALDFKTDSLLRQALATEVKSKTVLIVAQRISTILGADKIIVLDEGKIVGSGTHQELLKSSKVYREIAYSQLSEQELKNYEVNKLQNSKLAESK